MSRLIVLLIVFLSVTANAVYVGAGIGDSRIQSDNVVKDPAGILGLSLEAGVFDEPENMVDYKLSVELRRFGYSFDDGDNTVAFWAIVFKPLIWSVTYRNFVAEAYMGLSVLVSRDELNPKAEAKIDEFRDYLDGAFGFRLGYRIDEKWTVSFTGDFLGVTLHFPMSRNYDFIDRDRATYVIGGVGVSAQYSLF
jgi:hypothetical protein